MPSIPSTFEDVDVEQDEGGACRVLVVVGTRPEVIKLAPLIETLRANPVFAVTLCAVNQHTDLLRDALDDWQLVPDVEISVSCHGEGLAAMLAEVMPPVAAVICEFRPSAVIVQGDTITSMGAAIAAGYQQVPVAHVEAGLRTGDRGHPFPEEMHRVVIDHVSAVHYAPTEQARLNLLAEGCAAESIVVVGNTVVDALRMILDRPAAPVWEVGSGTCERRVLVTAHRRENFGEGIASICRAVTELVRRRSDVDIVYVLHPNPNARVPAVAALEGLPRVHLIEPVGYPAFVQLMAQADVIVTDSGGIQEEGPYLGRPIVVTREVTERSEGAEQGHAIVVGTDTEAIVEAVAGMLDSDATTPSIADGANGPYGDGLASERICADLHTRLQMAVDRV